MSLDDKFQGEYNDLNLVYDKEIKQKLVEGGIPTIPRLFPTHSQGSTNH